MTTGSLGAVQNMVGLNDSEKVFVAYQTGLAKWFVNRINPPSSVRDDLFQAAMLGIMMAKRKYDSSKGGSFSTYAFYHMKNCVLKELEFSNRIVDIRGDVIKRARDRRRVRARRLGSFDAFVKTGGFLTDGFQDAVMVQLKKVDRLEGMRFCKRDSDGNGVASYHDVLEDTSAVNPEDFVLRKEVEFEVKSIFELTGITFRERATKHNATRRASSYYSDDLVWNRFAHEMTLEQCGKAMGCSRERVRQIESRFLRSFKRRFRRKIRSSGEANIQEYKRLFGVTV